MSRDTLRLMGMQTKNGKTGPLMVQIRTRPAPRSCATRLYKTAAGAYRAWTREELGEKNKSAIMDEQIIGVFLTFSVVLAFLIGVGITSQTLRGAILSSIKEFASLRALGVGMGSLRIIVMELSWWVGVVGLIATPLFTFGVYLLATANGVPMGFPIPGSSASPSSCSSSPAPRACWPWAS
jgi:putative ABC transport system permease protein